MHKEANYLGMRSLREGGAGFTELQALKLDLPDREALATELVEANSQSHQVAAWLMRCERQTRCLSKCLDVFDLDKR